VEEEAAASSCLTGVAAAGYKGRRNQEKQWTQNTEKWRGVRLRIQQWKACHSTDRKESCRHSFLGAISHPHPHLSEFVSLSLRTSRLHSPIGVKRSGVAEPCGRRIHVLAYQPPLPPHAAQSSPSRVSHIFILLTSVMMVRKEWDRIEQHERMRRALRGAVAGALTLPHLFCLTGVVHKSAN